MARWYNRSMSIGASGSVMASRYNHLDLDPTYRNALGQPMMRMTFDFQKNEHLISTHASQVIDAIAKSLDPTILTRPAPRTGPWSVVPYRSTHNTGGTIMGSHPGNSVVNKYGQCWEVPNLFITGASVFPHNSACNPTGPVGALAYHTADAIKNRYVKRPGALA